MADSAEPTSTTPKGRTRKAGGKAAGTRKRAAPKGAAKTGARAARPRTKGGTATAPAAPAEAPKPRLVSGSAEADASPKPMRKKELIEAVVQRAGVKKKVAKPVIEAVLAELGQALADGREMNLQPLGKIKINRTREMEDGRAIVVRMRQKRDAPAADGTENSAKEALAEPTPEG